MPKPRPFIESEVEKPLPAADGCVYRGQVVILNPKTLFWLFLCLGFSFISGLTMLVRQGLEEVFRITLWPWTHLAVVACGTVVLYALLKFRLKKDPIKAVNWTKVEPEPADSSEGLADGVWKLRGLSIQYLSAGNVKIELRKLPEDGWQRFEVYACPRLNHSTLSVSLEEMASLYRGEDPRPSVRQVTEPPKVESPNA